MLKISLKSRPVKKPVNCIICSIMICSIFILNACVTENSSSANANDQKSSIIKMEDFSSSAIAVKSTYKELVSSMGMPERTYVTRFLRYTTDNTYADSCEVLVFPQQGLQYLNRNDSSFLFFIDFNADTINKLKYQNWVLDNHFTISDARSCFGAPDSCFTPCYGEAMMSGLDSAGFNLMIMDEGTNTNSSYDFYFGTDSCLKGMYFPIH